MNKNGNYIGTHLMMDITSYNRELLKDEGLVSKYVSKLIELADMTCLVAPQTFKFPFSNEYTNFLRKLREEGTVSPLIQERLDILDFNEREGSGVTGFGILAESHVAIHTFPEKDEPFMSVCLYSCKWFDAQKIIDYTNKYWQVHLNNLMVVDRFVGEPQKVRVESHDLANKEVLNV